LIDTELLAEAEAGSVSLDESPAPDDASVGASPAKVEANGERDSQLFSDSDQDTLELNRK
jgi:hypothetical protein